MLERAPASHHYFKDSIILLHVRNKITTNNKINPPLVAIAKMISNCKKMEIEKPTTMEGLLQLHLTSLTGS